MENTCIAIAQTLEEDGEQLEEFGKTVTEFAVKIAG